MFILVIAMQICLEQITIIRTPKYSFGICVYYDKKIECLGFLLASIYVFDSFSIYFVALHFNQNMDRNASIIQMHSIDEINEEEKDKQTIAKIKHKLSQVLQ